MCNPSSGSSSSRSPAFWQPSRSPCAFCRIQSARRAAKPFGNADWTLTAKKVGVRTGALRAIFDGLSSVIRSAVELERTVALLARIQTRPADNKPLHRSGGSFAVTFRNFTCRHSMNGGRSSGQQTFPQQLSIQMASAPNSKSKTHHR